MSAMIGVRNRAEIRYVSVQQESELERELRSWAPDRPRAEALIAFGPLYQISYGISRYKAGTSGTLECDASGYFESAVLYARANVVALHDATAGGWQIWTLYEAEALEALNCASEPLARALELARQARESAGTSLRMKASVGVKARLNARELAHEVIDEINNVSSALARSWSAMYGSSMLDETKVYFRDATKGGANHALCLRLERGLATLDAYAVAVGKRRETALEAVASFPPGALAVIARRRTIEAEESQARRV